MITMCWENARLKLDPSGKEAEDKLIKLSEFLETLDEFEWEKPLEGVIRKFPPNSVSGNATA